MDQSGPYVVSIQPEHLRKGVVRYHWMICRADAPDHLVSWGYASSQESAEMAARQELDDLKSGLTRGGRVTTAKSFVRYR